MKTPENTKSYANIFLRNQTEPVYCYRSGLTVYEERLLDGALVPGGWNAAGYPLNVLSNYPSFIDLKTYAEPTAFHVELDGETVDFFLEYKGYEEVELENGSKEAILTLASTVKPVEIRVHTLVDGTAVFTRWLEITNLSDKDMALSRLSVLSGALDQVKNIKFYDADAHPEDIYEIGYFRNDRAMAEGDFGWKPLGFDRTAISGRFHRERYRYPAFFLKNKLTGMIWFGQIGWSAGYEFLFDYNAFHESNSVSLSYEISVTGYHPLRLIAAGETYVSPQVHMGAVFGTLDDAVNAGYDHIRRSVFNVPEANGDACLVGIGYGAHHDMSVESTKGFADQLKSVGGETFIIDAGWYRPPGNELSEWYKTGDWQYDRERYPNGIDEVIDYIHGSGLKFGLWMEPERFWEESKIFNEHPEWFKKRAFGKMYPGIIDFTNPEAAAWVENEIARVVVEYRLDVLRIDYNYCNGDQYHYVTPGERCEYASIRHAEAVSAMYGRLKKRFPHVIFENCASGGGRLDLDILRHFHHSWVSDEQRAPVAQYITNGLTLVLPPERVDRLVSGMNCHECASLDAHIRNAMLGHISLNALNPLGAEDNDMQREVIKHALDIYKSFIRPMLPSSRMYHHNEDIPGVRRDGYSALELASHDRTRAAITVFTVPGSRAERINLIPRGLDLSHTYRVTLDNTGETMTVTGRDLMVNGVTTRIMGIMTSELILIEAIDQ